MHLRTTTFQKGFTSRRLRTLTLVFRRRSRHHKSVSVFSSELKPPFSKSRRRRQLQFQLVDEPPEVQRREAWLAVLEARPRIAPSAARARARPRTALVARCGDRCLHSARFVRADVAEEHALFGGNEPRRQDKTQVRSRRGEWHCTQQTPPLLSHRHCDRVLIVCVIVCCALCSEVL